MFLKLLLLTLVLQLSPLHAKAHTFELGVVKTNLTIQKQNLPIRTEVNERVELGAPDRQLQLQIGEAYFGNNFIVKNDGRQCSFKLQDFSYPEAKKTVFSGTYTCPNKVKKIANLQIHSTVFSDFFTSFEHFVNITSGKEKTSIIFNQSVVDYPKAKANEEQSQKTETQNNLYTVAKEFVKLGAEHIWKGFDHILFLLMLVLLLRSYKHILEVITAFTIAHSITLILAGTGTALISPRIVEPLIALTIVAVAIRNIKLINKGELEEHTRERWMTAAGFGLIHGLGFAGALEELKIPADQFLPSLIFFNIGVELGQIVLLCVIIPILLAIDKSKRRLGILENIAIIVAIQSSIWFFQRLFT